MDGAEWPGRTALDLMSAGATTGADHRAALSAGVRVGRARVATMRAILSEIAAVGTQRVLAISAAGSSASRMAMAWSVGSSFEAASAHASCDWRQCVVLRHFSDRFE